MTDVTDVALPCSHSHAHTHIYTMHAYTEAAHTCKSIRGHRAWEGGIFRLLRNVLLTQHRVDEFLMPDQRERGRKRKKMNKVKYLICAVA